MTLGRMASRILLILVFFALNGREYFVNGVITDVRLVGAPTSDRGTVEVKQDNGSWETTCGTFLGINDVIVICRQLGFFGGNRAIQATPYQQASPPSIGLSCNGDEPTLSDCGILPPQSQSQCVAAGAASCHGDRYLGCYKDDPASRVFPRDNLLAEPQMTISYCIDFCRGQIIDYIYAGVENGNECFCGSANDRYDRIEIGTDLNCQSPCQGDATESCGGVPYIAVFRINPPPTTTPKATTTVQLERRTTDRGTAGPPPSAEVTTMGIRPTSLPRNGGDGRNLGLYAGVAGGVIFVIVVIVVIIVVVMVKRKGSRPKKKDHTNSHGLSVMPPSSPTSGQDNIYHDMFHEDVEQTPNGSSAPLDETTYYSAVRDEDNSPVADDTYYSSINNQNGANSSNGIPSKHHEDSTDKANVRLPPNGDVEAMYAMPDKQTSDSPTGQDFGALYAKPDKTGKVGEKQSSGNFGALYAMPDKSRGVPEGREEVNIGDLYAKPDKSGDKVGMGLGSGALSVEEGLYSVADDDGLYATSGNHESATKPGDEYGVVMVDNELYTM